MLYKLVSAEGDQSFDLRGSGTLVVGRALNSDIPVFDPTISRRHAEVSCDAEGVKVRDLGSSNGTYLNGAKITAARVAPGDVVTFGKVAFRLREVAPSAGGPRAGEGGPPPSGGGGLGNATILRQLRVSGEQRLRLPASLLATDSRPAVNGGPSAPRDVELAQQKLTLLLEVATGLSGAVDVDALLEKIAGYSFDILDVDRVAILLADPVSGELVPKIARDRRGSDAGRAVPQSIARKVVEEKVAILSDNAPEDQRFGGQSILLQRVRSAMCAPLVGREESALGVLYVDNLTATHRFEDDDLELLVAFAGIAAVAIENSQLAERSRREALVRANFERYFAPSLAARIAESPGALTLGGEKRSIAVLFSDIRGFTPLSETMRPDDIAALLSEYFTEMVECVFRNGGTLDKFVGDSVMAQWGAPISAPDDPDRALHAAVEMLEALAALNAKWRREGRPELQVGIGLNYGEAFAGNIGSERRLEFTVIGDTVNTAARLCAAAEGGEILVTDALRRALRAPPRLEVCDPLALKGKSSTVPVYRVRR